MEHSFIEKYVGLRIVGGQANVARFYSTIAGRIRTVRVRMPSISLGTHIFSFLKNGVAQYTPAGNMIIVTPGTPGEKLDQDIAVAVGDLLSFNVFLAGAGGAIQPIYFEVVIDDQLPAEEIAEIETDPLAIGATETGTVNLGLVSIISEMTADDACRVRLYRTPEHRTADEERPIGTDPTGDHGLIVECVFTGSGTLIASQPAIATDNDDPRTGLIPYSIQNLSGDADKVLTVTIPHLVQER